MGKSESDWEYFKRCLIKAWEAIPQARIDGLILSIGRRLKALRKARGFYTKY